METTDVVVRMQQGDDSAVADLYGAFAESAIRTAFLITYDQAAAEDAVQEAFLQVLRRITTLRDPATFRSWFFQIVVNTAKRSTRRRFRLLPFDETHQERPDLTAQPPDEPLLLNEEIEALRRAMQELTQTLRLPVILRYFTGLSETEVAEALNIPHGTVKSRLHAARRLLHDRLKGERPPSLTVAKPATDRSGE